MTANPAVVILAPDARDPSGTPLHLCKRYPTVLALLLRGFAPAAVRDRFNSSLARYEMRDLPRDRPVTGVPLLSGSFMFCRRAPLGRDRRLSPTGSSSTSRTSTCRCARHAGASSPGCPRCASRTGAAMPRARAGGIGSCSLPLR
jgi:hypothetical protein